MAPGNSTVPFLQRLKATAQAEGKSVETFVTDAINNYIAREQAKAEPSAPPTPLS